MINKLKKNTFINASFWMFVATGFLNVGNFAYHGIMGRLLGRDLLGGLESVISLLYILGIPMVTISLVIIKFTSEYKGKEDQEKISAIYYYFKKKMLLVGIISSLLLLVLSPFISSFLHLSSPTLIYLLSINFFLGLFVMVDRSIIQGISQFSTLAVSNVIETISKLLISFLLVWIGFKANGAFGGVVLSGVFALLYLEIFISRKITFTKTDFTHHKDVFLYVIPVFLNTLFLSSIFTIDVLMVRHFFPGPLSGDYSAVSLLGKIIYFGISPIIAVMFPLVSEYHASGKKYTHLLFYSLLFTAVTGVGVLIFYIVNPSLFILLLFGKKFLIISPYLSYFAVFMIFYTLSTLLANFYLSIRKLTAIYFIVFSGVLQIILFFLYHRTLFDIIAINIFISVLLFILLVLYYPYATKQKNLNN